MPLQLARLRKTKTVEIFKARGKRNQFYKVLHKLADTAAPKVYKSFLAILEAMRNRVTLRDLRIAIEDGNTDAIETLLQLDKFQNMLRPVADELRQVFIDAAKATRKAIPQKVLVKANEVDVELAIAFDLLNPQTIQFLRDYEFDLIRNIDQQTVEGIRAIMVDAFQSGKHPYQQARMIREGIGLLPRDVKALMNYEQLLIDEGVPPVEVKKKTDAYHQRLLNRRAKTIARTETIRAANTGQYALWQQAIDQGLIDPDVKVEWIVTPDDKLCPICEGIADNGPVTFGQEFTTTLERPLSRDLTYQGQTPPIHPNCVIGNSVIHNADILATSKRFYEGSVIVIETASGNKITCTSNHPILSFTGWKTADSFKKGDKVISSSSRQRARLCVNGYYENMPAIISEICETASNSFGVPAFEVPLSAEDFHGDGINGDIAVIRTYGFLKSRIKTFLNEDIVNDDFVIRNMKLLNFFGFSSLTQRFESTLTSPYRFMRSSDLISSFGFRHAIPFDFFSFALRSDSNVIFDKGAGKRFPISSMFSSKIINGLPAKVFVDNVVKVYRVPFSGHVYNLQTDTEMYTCNGIITHNCRCALGLTF